MQVPTDCSNKSGGVGGGGGSFQTVDTGSDIRLNDILAKSWYPTPVFRSCKARRPVNSPIDFNEACRLQVKYTLKYFAGAGP